MTALNPVTYPSKQDFRMTMVVARREIRDSFRDWRIIIPIFALTLIFPALMNFTASRILNFVADFGAEVIANQLIPFLLLVVGFFPMSFSLIIALETFVGEKERKSMEPLLFYAVEQRAALCRQDVGRVSSASFSQLFGDGGLYDWPLSKCRLAARGDAANSNCLVDDGTGRHYGGWGGCGL